MSRVKFCPKCMNIIHKKDTECSNCGMLVSDMENEERVEEKLKPQKKEKPVMLDENGNPLSKKEQRKKLKEKQIDFEEEFYESDEESKSLELDNRVNAISEEGENDENTSIASIEKPKRHKHKPKKKEAPEFTVNETGEYEINTKDVTFFENNEEYSIRKARGDYEPEKLKWWEIYKWADRMLARRKVKKQVNKASTVKPEYISKTKLLILCALFGWMGGHNLYAGNKAKGWTILGMFVVMLLVIYINPLAEIMGTFIGGGFGFAIMCMWFYDFFAICFNKYKYHVTKMQFIRKLNVETRAKLGKKYINMK